MLLIPIILSCILSFSVRALGYKPELPNMDVDAVDAAAIHDDDPDLLSMLKLEVRAEDAADENAVQDDDPDLLNMLNFFKGKSDINILTTFLKQYKAYVAIGRALMDVCVPCKEVYKDVSKTNAGLRILDKMAQGHAPDIKDIYDLATKGAGHMSQSLHAAQAKNLKYKKIVSMLEQGSAMFSSVSSMEEFLDDATGHHFTIDPALLKDVADGSVTFTRDNIAQANLLLMMSTLADNFELIERGIDHLNLISILKLLQSFNISSISKIKAISQTTNDSKYSVTEDGKAFTTDPDVVKFLQDIQKAKQFLKTKSQDQSKGEALFVEALSHISTLTAKTIKTAENTPRNLPPV